MSIERSRSSPRRPKSNPRIHRCSAIWVRLMASTGLVEEAEAMLRQALSLDRGLADAWVNLARVLVQDGREVEGVWHRT